MIQHNVENHSFFLSACLPFVELANEKIIRLGPIIFWPASKSKEILQAKDHTNFHSYLSAIGRVKAQSVDRQDKLFEILTLSPKNITCVSISEEIPMKWKEFILIDALYLLYFACTFKDIYYGFCIPPFHPFRKIIPASVELIRFPQNFEQLFIRERQREETIILNHIDPEMTLALGNALSIIYTLPSQHQKELNLNYKRLVRSIRFLVDRFFERFVNLLGVGLNLTQELFEPEDIIFLTTSFETLFNINDKHPSSDFKHKLRPLLQLKYSRPVEIFWKWVDDFYQLKRQIILGEPFLNTRFQFNPNFEISHPFLGIKLLVYSIYYQLFKLHLLHPIHVDSYSPPDFYSIHPEEVLLFFWTEITLLQKIKINVNHFLFKHLNEELISELHLLTSLFVSLYERYYLQQQINGVGMVLFIPTPAADLSIQGSPIIQLLENEMTMRKKELMEGIHSEFLISLKKRLNFHN